MCVCDRIVRVNFDMPLVRREKSPSRASLLALLPLLTSHTILNNAIMPIISNRHKKPIINGSRTSVNIRVHGNGPPPKSPIVNRIAIGLTRTAPGHQHRRVRRTKQYFVQRSAASLGLGTGTIISCACTAKVFLSCAFRAIYIR